MPTTPYGFRYPAATDAPNGPLQIQNLATDVNAAFAPPNWTDLTIAGFTAIAGVTPQYTRTMDRVVYLRGGMFNISSYAAPSGVFATLPVGYRPTQDMLIPVFYGMVDANYSAHLSIWKDGTMRFDRIALSPPANTAHWISGVSFIANQ